MDKHEVFQANITLAYGPYCIAIRSALGVHSFGVLNGMCQPPLIKQCDTTPGVVCDISYLRLGERQYSLGDFICQLLPAYRLSHAPRIKDPDLRGEGKSQAMSDNDKERPTLRTCRLHEAYPGHCQARSAGTQANRAKHKPQASS